jgi:hypothetical protein
VPLYLFCLGQLFSGNITTSLKLPRWSRAHRWFTGGSVDYRSCDTVFDLGQNDCQVAMVMADGWGGNLGVRNQSIFNTLYSQDHTSLEAIVT